MLIHSISDDFVPSVMRTDILERRGQFLIEIELPGYHKENITAQLENGYLTIIARRNEEIGGGEDAHYVMKERTTGEERRTFYVGDSVKHEDISAALKDGVLSIIIMKREAQVEGERRKLIPIQ